MCVIRGVIPIRLIGLIIIAFSIDNIAPTVGVAYEIAVKDLQKMIDSSYFVGAYINEGNREIVLAKAVPQPMPQHSDIQAQIKGVVCGSCGANNSVAIGWIAECEYCGIPIIA